MAGEKCKHLVFQHDALWGWGLLGVETELEKPNRRHHHPNLSLLLKWMARWGLLQL
jgi:hypothetical protein